LSELSERAIEYLRLHQWGLKQMVGVGSRRQQLGW